MTSIVYKCVLQYRSSYFSPSQLAIDLRSDSMYPKSNYSVLALCVISSLHSDVGNACDFIVIILLQCYGILGGSPLICSDNVVTIYVEIIKFTLQLGTMHKNQDFLLFRSTQSIL